ncbi:MAG: hydrogenase nickel incorporation protein HypB [Clostridiales Family XIII bacterium]|jgi:hydrogenase nickel incorporation protein HypB|nr:hydrogenase nickel incorporation protein HypB [Clostridiales Family XIII bacterium]
MHDVNRISVMEDIHGENGRIAAEVNHSLTHKSAFAVNVMGAPGIGKTTVLLNIIERLAVLAPEVKPLVIEGDIASDIDTQTFRSLGIAASQINTFGACHLDAPQIHNAVNNIDFSSVGGSILFIENVGNLVCPAEFSIGEHVKLLICSVTEGSDKPYKYPLAFEKAGLILLNKVDLAPHLDFDEEFFMKGVRALNKSAPVIKVSGKTGEGFSEVAEVLLDMKSVALSSHSHSHSHSHE